MTTVTIIGNLAADPELRFTPSGKAVARYTVIENRNRRTDAGEWEQGEPNVFHAETWGQQGENLAESVTKGDRVFVTGQIFTDRWNDKETGEPRTMQKLRGDEVGPTLKWATAKPVKVSGNTENHHEGGAQN